MLTSPRTRTWVNATVPPTEQPSAVRADCPGVAVSCAPVKLTWLATWGVGQADLTFPHLQPGALQVADGGPWPGFSITTGSDRGPDPIEVVDYDPAWPGCYEQWRECGFRRTGPRLTSPMVALLQGFAARVGVPRPEDLRLPSGR